MEKLLNITKKILVLEIVFVGIFLLFSFAEQLPFETKGTISETFWSVLTVMVIFGMQMLFILPLVIAIIIFAALVIHLRRKQSQIELTRSHKVLLWILLVSFLTMGGIWALDLRAPYLQCTDQVSIVREELERQLFLVDIADILTTASIVATVIIFLLTILLYFFTKTKGALFTLLLVSSMTLGLFSSRLFLNSAAQPLIYYHDSRRVSDIQNIRTALEIYKNDKRTYPIVVDPSPSLRWKSLEAFLAPNYVPALAKDRCSSENLQWQYDYKSSINGDAFVLKATLQDYRWKALGEDVDGEILGIWCGKEGREVEYCITQ